MMQTTLVVTKLVGFGLVGLMVGCTSPQSPEMKSASTVQVVEAKSQLSPTQIETILVEGEPQEITLLLYQEEGIPVVTYYPDTLTAMAACSEEGCGVFFQTDSSENSGLYAQVHIFVPPIGTTLEQLESGVTGDRGLLESNGWQKQAEYTELDTPSDTLSNPLRYPWMKTAIAFTELSENIFGTIYFGQFQDRVFRVTVSYSGDQGDGFVPRSDIILKYLQVHPQ